VIRKFSRRSAEIDKLADELGVTSIVAKDKLGAIEIKAFADHHVITQPNPLRKVS